MPPLFTYKARVRQSGRIWEGFCISSCSGGGGASHYEWKAKGGHGHKGLKPESVFFWHNMQNWLFFFFFLKTCGKRLQTDFSVRQVPALPSAFSFTSLSVCSQPIPSSFHNPDSSISLHLSFSLSHQSDQFDALFIMCWHTPFRYLEEIKSGEKSNRKENVLTSGMNDICGKYWVLIVQLYAFTHAWMD